MGVEEIDFFGPKKMGRPRKPRPHAERHPRPEEWDDLCEPLLEELCELCETLQRRVSDRSLSDRLQRATTWARIFLYRRDADRRQSLGMTPNPPTKMAIVPEETRRVWGAVCRLWAVFGKRPHIREVADELEMATSRVGLAIVDCMRLGLLHSRNGRWEDITVLLWPEGEEPPEQLKRACRLTR